MENKKAIEISNLVKMYGKERGVLGVNLDVEEGEIFGFIGPNGAGKSTTIRTLLGLIFKTSGEMRIFGQDVEKNHAALMADIGYLPSEVFYYDNMRAAELLRYSASFYKKDCSERIKYLADCLHLDLNKKIEDMSLGNKKKVGIVQGLLHSPKLIILDEPTSGLDPLMQKNFFELIKQENERGATVLFSSHILSEVQKICHRVAIIKDGVIIETKKIGELTHGNYKKVCFEPLGEYKDIDLDGISDYKNSDGEVSFLFNGDINDLIRAIAACKLRTVAITEPDLEEIFMHHYV